MTTATARLWQAFGVELEYMIVDRESLAVRPIAKEILEELGAVATPWPVLERGEVTWSNEIVLHVLEMKNRRPVPALEALVEPFAEAVAWMNGALARHDACLLPTAMHPFMDPRREAVLFDHPIYAGFDRIYDVRTHGQANIQSAQLNLSFDGDGELTRLHAAVRLLLPLVPALAASSPLLGGRRAGRADARLHEILGSSRRLPAAVGLYVPDHVATRAEYEREVLERIWADAARFDPDGVMRGEFMDQRGAVPRFGRSALEIRAIDVQETPAADLAIAAGIIAVLMELVEGGSSDTRLQAALDTERLAALMRATIDAGEAAEIDEPAYLVALGLPPRPTGAREVWSELFERTRLLAGGGPFAAGLGTILARGTLSRRIERALRDDPSPEAVAQLYRRLAGCLAEGVQLS